MCLFFHVSIILFWWLWFCSVYWNQVSWCFGFGSFYLRLSWIFRLLNVFLRERILLVVQQGSHWIYRFLWAIQVFININSSDLCKWKSFPLSCMFVNFFLILCNFCYSCLLISNLISRYFTFAFFVTIANGIPVTISFLANLLLICTKSTGFICWFCILLLHWIYQS